MSPRRRCGLNLSDYIKQSFEPLCLPIVSSESRVKMSDDDTMHLQGPIELIEGRWLMRIPLAAGGAQLIHATRGIGKVVADVLEIEVPGRLIKTLGLRDGQTVSVHNKDGKFTFNWDPGEKAH